MQQTTIWLWLLLTKNKNLYNGVRNNSEPDYKHSLDSMPAAVSMCQAKLKKEKGSMVGGICISISYGCRLPLARKVREIFVYAKSFT